MRKTKQSDRRWVILGEDGRFVTLGRASDPTPEEIARSEQALQATGTAGWLAVMDGTPYAARPPALMAVRPLAGPVGSFESAVGAFRRARGGAAA